jgi:mRNA interferase HigB
LTVLSRRRIEEYACKHPDVAETLRAWYKIARKALWKNLEDVRAQINSADRVDRVLIFNIGGNKYRLIVKVDFRSNLLMVKDLLTHKEYDRGGWRKWRQ